MRRVFCISFLFLVVLLVTSGCTQPSSAPTTVTTIQPTPVAPLTVTATPDTTKHLTFDISNTEKTVNITYTGGPDSADVQALNIRIYNKDLTTFERTVIQPVAGDSYVFTYVGLANSKNVNIVGTFKGDYKQTVLMYYF